MKKLLTILLCLTLLLLPSCTSPQDPTSPTESETSAPVADTGRLTLAALEEAATREELAALIGVNNVDEMEQMLVYLKHFYDLLPNEGDPTEPVTEWAKREDGVPYLTLKQAKSMVQAQVVTTGNWMEFIVPKLDEDSGMVEIAYRDGVYFNEEPRICLTNQITGEEFEYDGWYWPEEIICADGEFFMVTYDESRVEHLLPLSEENYICTFADAVAYSYELPRELCYVDTWEVTESGTVYRPANDEEWAEKQCFVMVQYGATADDICLVGYAGFGNYAYTCSDAELFPDNEKKPVEIKDARALTLEKLKALKTREELAALIGVADASTLKQKLTYLENYYENSLSADETLDTSKEWGTTSDGYLFMTVAQVKALVTPTIITTENWKEYILPHMEPYIYCYYDSDGNEVTEIREQPDISFAESVYPSSDAYLILKNAKTGQVLKFEGNDWPEYVTLEDGKYYVSSYDADGNSTTVEFDPANYSCIYADAVVYSYEIPEELLYVECYDEKTSYWITVPMKGYEGDETPFVKVKVREGEFGVRNYGYKSLGKVLTE